MSTTGVTPNHSTKPYNPPMKCLFPLKLPHVTTKCGQCMPCRISKNREWASRLIQEQGTTEYRSWFLTLTYNEENLPKTTQGDPTLEKTDTQKWLKRARRMGYKFRYFVVGEYGTSTRRPHYHALIFPASDLQIQEFRSTWTLGQTTVGEATTERAKYCAQYTIKKLNASKEEELYGRNPEFATMSRKPGIGNASAQNIAATYETKYGAMTLAEQGDIQPAIRIGGKILPIGEYGKKKIRERLGIPDTRIERIKRNPNVEHYFPLDEELVQGAFAKNQRLKRGQKIKKTLTNHSI